MPIFINAKKTLLREIAVMLLRVPTLPNLKYNDGTPFADGNPIFSAVAPDRRLGVRVIQVDPSEEPRELAVWTDTFAEGEPEAVKELVITCALTPQTLGNSLALMERWITKEDAGVAEEGAWGSASDANDFDAPHGVA